MLLQRILMSIYGRLGGRHWLQQPILERLYLAAFFLYKRHLEDPFAHLARRRPDLFRGGHVLDVGANVGYTATVFAKSVESPFLVIAFEPEPVNFETLLRVIRRRRIDRRVVAVRAAVGATSGERHLAVNDAHPGDHRVVSGSTSRPTIAVEMVSIDDYVDAHGLDDVRFVKIDVQGLELEVSRGMERLLEKHRAVAVAFEIEEARSAEQRERNADLLAFSERRGFTLKVIGRRGDLLPATEDSFAREFRRRKYGDVLAVRESGS